MFKKIHIDNFRDISVRGENALSYRANAKVDITTTTGFFNKKQLKKTHNIHKDFAGGWFFIDTGNYCPRVIENLQRSYEAVKGHSIWQTR